MLIDRGKRSKALNEVKPVGNISKNPQSFLEMNPSHKLQDHDIVTKSCGIKGR